MEKTITFSVAELGVTTTFMVSAMLTTQEYMRPEARFYQVIDGKPTRIGGLRHDYSVEPPSDTLLNILGKQLTFSFSF